MSESSPIRLFGESNAMAYHVSPAGKPAPLHSRPLDKGIAEGEEREVLDRLAPIGTTVRLRTGETLYVEGEPPGKCYEVVSGLLKEYNTLKDGSCHIADFRYPGDLVGLPCSGVYQHTVEAVEDTHLMSFPARRFRELVADDPALSAWFSGKLLSDLERSRANALALSRLSALERVARFLVTLSEATSPSRKLDGAFAIPMSRQDMADHLGLTIETVCRCLTSIKGKGLITMPTAHGFRISDPAALASLACREDARPPGRQAV